MYVVTQLIAIFQIQDKNLNKKSLFCWFYKVSPQDLLGEFLFLTNLVIINFSSNQNYLEYIKTILYLYNIFLTNINTYV